VPQRIRGAGRQIKRVENRGAFTAALRPGTRKEELLYRPDEYSRIVILRRALTGVPPVKAMELFPGKLKKTKSNSAFLPSRAAS